MSRLRALLIFSWKSLRRRSAQCPSMRCAWLHVTIFWKIPCKKREQSFLVGAIANHRIALPSTSLPSIWNVLGGACWCHWTWRNSDFLKHSANAGISAVGKKTTMEAFPGLALQNDSQCSWEMLIFIRPRLPSTQSADSGPGAKSLSNILLPNVSNTVRWSAYLSAEICKHRLIDMTNPTWNGFETRRQIEGQSDKSNWMTQ